jgi:leucyl-tRNA synthetase
LLSPFAPHIAEELWEKLGFENTAAGMKWPEYDESKTIDSECLIAVQVGGKMRTTITAPLDTDEETVLSLTLANDKIAKLVEGKEIVRKIVVKNKLINIIVK